MTSKSLRTAPASSTQAPTSTRAPQSTSPSNSDVASSLPSTQSSGTDTASTPSLPEVAASMPGASEEEVMHEISLIVRGKTGPDQHPGVMAQHADVILSNGAPAGFFGDGGALPSIGLGMNGVVADQEWFENNRPSYVDGDLAAAHQMPSTVLTVQVTAEQAERFDEYWQKLAEDPGTFSLLGDNCSTHAAEAFAYAGITSGGIPGMDTPDNLYEQIMAAHPDAVSQSGYLGFQQAADGTFSHSVQTGHDEESAGDYDKINGNSSVRSGLSTADSSGANSGSSSRGTQESTPESANSFPKLDEKVGEKAQSIL